GAIGVKEEEFHLVDPHSGRHIIDGRRDMVHGQAEDSLVYDIVEWLVEIAREVDLAALPQHLEFGDQLTHGSPDFMLGYCLLKVHAHDQIDVELWEPRTKEFKDREAHT